VTALPSTNLSGFVMGAWMTIIAFTMMMIKVAVTRQPAG
jgi:hypothetical protein